MAVPEQRLATLVHPAVLVGLSEAHAGVGASRRTAQAGALPLAGLLHALANARAGFAPALVRDVAEPDPGHLHLQVEVVPEACRHRHGVPDGVLGRAPAA